MAFVYVVLIPVLLVSVFIPRLCETSALFEKHSEISEIDHPDVLKEEVNDMDRAVALQRHRAHNPRHEFDNESSAETNQGHRSVGVNVEPHETDAGGHAKSESVPAVVGCPGCYANKQEEKEHKINVFKQTLLRKLGLSSPPKVKGPLFPLPFDFYVGEDYALNDAGRQQIEDEPKPTVQTKKIFVFGKDITHKCNQKKATGCYSFDVTNSTIDPDQIASVEIWIYKQPDVNDHHLQTFMVSELEPYTKHGDTTLRIRNIVKRIETRLKYGWMKVYVKRTVSRWLSKPHRNHGLAVVCRTCQRKNHKTIYGYKEGYMPILVFYMKQKQRLHRRSKRYVDCSEGGTNCCHMEPLVFNFREQGWDYIMAPEEITINYCTGSCNGLMAGHHNHTRFVQAMQQSAGNNHRVLQSCCSPVSFGSPQSLLYRDHEGYARSVNVPDLVASDCGCT